MSLVRNVEIPVRFGFLPFNSRWQKSEAEVIGWAEKPDQVELLFTDGVNTHEGMTTVRVSVPTGGELGSISSNADSSQCFYTIEIPSADLPPSIMRVHENRRTTPDIGGRRFSVLICVLPELTDRLGVPKPGKSERDAWKMREEFLGMKFDVDALCGFLNRWGQWSRARGYNLSYLEKPHGFKVVIPHLIWRRYDEYRTALTSKPQKWLSQAGFPGLLSRIPRPPYFEVRHSYCESTLAATITFDLLSRAEFGVCRLDICQKIFQRGTKQKRFFCSQTCAHTANVRAIRKKKKGMETQLKGAGTHAARKS